LGCTAGDDSCTRGVDANLYRWAFFHALLWACFGFVAVAMYLIYTSIRAQELATEKYRNPSGGDSFELQKQLHGGGASAGDSNELPASEPFPAVAPIAPTASAAAATAARRSGDGTADTDRRRRGSINNNNSLSRRFAVQAWYYVLAFFLAWIFPMVQFLVAEIDGDGMLLFPLLALTVLVNPLQGFLNAVIYIRPRFLRYYGQIRQRRMRRSSTSDGLPPGERGIGTDSEDASTRKIPLSLQALALAVSVDARDDEDDLEDELDAETSEFGDVAMVTTVMPVPPRWK